MMEREMESETLTVRGQPVLNEIFGVHKALVVSGRGEPQRTLRLIENLIPSNSVQRRLPLRPSEKMSWAPLWGQLRLLEDEVVLAYGEDIKHCFHIFAPGPAWRGYFVISKKASGACFKDGNKTPSRPRVKSAPMGWSNIFVQSGTLAGIPSRQIARMGEPSPLLELRTPRDYFTFCGQFRWVQNCRCYRDGIL